MSDTQKPQSLAEIARAALTGMLDTALPCLEEWAKQYPSTEQYFCTVDGCPGHNLKGSQLAFLEDSRLFSYNVNGNGFSAANAGSITVEGEEIPLKVFWNAAAIVVPVCQGSQLPIVRDFTTGEKARVQFTTRTVEENSSKDQGSENKSGGGRRRSNKG